MSIKIDKTIAKKVVRDEAQLAEQGPLDPDWVDKIEQLSKLCDEGSKTHIAFLGTEILAKAVEPTVDLNAIKPEHAPNNPRAFSARTLCHSVLVPLAADLGFDIGVSGREPLNNQPYFRMEKLNDGTPVHASGAKAFEYMLKLVAELQGFTTQQQARSALRAFIAVRRNHQRQYEKQTSTAGAISPKTLTKAIEIFVGENSEGGRRAQAVVAGLLDVFAGSGRVESGRINDPSRHYPGDVCVHAAGNKEAWEKSFEVRDKPVAVSDVQIFVKKCTEKGVREAAVLMAAPNHGVIDTAELGVWAAQRGVSLTLFKGWTALVDQTLFWSELPKPEAAANAVGKIRQRLISAEVSTDGVALWDALTNPAAS